MMMMALLFSIGSTVSSSARMIHQYTFNTGSLVTDGVGASAGTLMGGATMSGGQALFPYQGPYVQLPAGVLGSSSSVSIEMWMYVSSSNTASAPRMIDFGTKVNNMNIARDFNGFFLLQYNSPTGWVSNADTSFAFASLGYVHVVLVVPSGGYAQLYVNGNLALIAPSTFTIPSVSQQTLFYIGKSLTAVDVGLVGSVDELRIWSSALDATQVKASYTAGRFVY